MKNLLIILFVGVIAFGCGDNSENTIVEKDEKTTSPYFGHWDSKGRRMYTSSLVINEDSTFHFSYGACQMSGFSFGKWTANGDEIVLNSIIDSSECLFASEFLNNNIIIVEDSIIEPELKTTINDCSPVSIDEEYILFNNERFKISDDTLIHKNSIERDDFDPTSHYKFSRRVE